MRFRAQAELARAEQENTQRSIQVAREKAANEAKSEFMSLMCHEVRTPLNGCLASAEMLLETCLDEDQRELAQTIRVSGSILLSTVSNFLDYFKMEASDGWVSCCHASRLEGRIGREARVTCVLRPSCTGGQEAGYRPDRGRPPPDRQRCHGHHRCNDREDQVNGPLEPVLSSVEPKWFGVLTSFSARGLCRGVELKRPDLGALPAQVLGDPFRMRGVLLNLMTNAAKFTKQGHIALRVSIMKEEQVPNPPTGELFSFNGQAEAPLSARGLGAGSSGSTGRLAASLTPSKADMLRAGDMTRSFRHSYVCTEEDFGTSVKAGAEAGQAQQSEPGAAPERRRRSVSLPHGSMADIGPESPPGAASGAAAPKARCAPQARSFAACHSAADPLYILSLPPSFGTIPRDLTGGGGAPLQSRAAQGTRSRSIGVSTNS